MRLEIVGIVLLSCTQILSEHRDFYGPYNQHGHQRHRHQNWDDDRMTKEVRVTQGRLRGFIVQPKTNPRMQMVDVFLGIPYAEPPVGPFRFSPPRSPQPWRDIRPAQEFAPVCPQVLPNLRLEVKPGRHEYLERLLPYLKNQSEDCLYLNIYAPHQVEGQVNSRRYPVMVFIHGESFEWNSGNPYDGTVLAAYGNVVFVTINFRLGILGFLRPGTSDDAASNFGLLDQTAALLWLKENIAQFGGDPDIVTIVGHGTGAIFANLLLISPVANNKGLFKRAILMSGSALSSDAIGKAPLQITKQVAYALNCPTTNDNELASCLRNRDVDRLLNVRIDKPRYVPAFAPLIDRAVVPKKPLRLMENAQVFGSFDLMYGVTESEKFHILPPVAVLHGMLDGQRDEAIRDHAKATHELEPELILSRVLEHYGGDFLDGFTNDYPTKNRDIVLDVFSDSGTVAPLLMTGKLHAKANPKSYMYVFSHPRAMQDYSGQQRQHTVHGEELPYVLGVPLDGGKYHLRGRYNIGETLFSEAMMTWWCNFAYTGNPNAPRRMTYLTDGPKEWRQYQLDWPEFNIVDETYFNLTIPPRVGRKYREAEMQFWNEDIPNLIRHRPRGPRPEFLDHADRIGKYRNTSSFEPLDGFGIKPTTGIPANFDPGYGSINEQSGPFDRFPISHADASPGQNVNNNYSNDNNNNDDEDGSVTESSFKASSTFTMVVGISVFFLLVNFTILFYIYHRRQRLKKSKDSPLTKNLKRSSGKSAGNTSVLTGSRKSKANHHQHHNNNDKQGENCGELNRKCDSKLDIHQVIKSDKAYDNSSNFGRQSKLSRQNSSSTIDTHIKVKEWIQQEIVHRCSPRFLRKTRETLQKEHQEKITQQQSEEDRKKVDDQLKMSKSEPIYDQSPALTIRPGVKKSKTGKVSVGIDATPATRTESILNQIPIELVKDINAEDTNAYEEFIDIQTAAPQVVVIEHHHSRSDPLPMESVFKTTVTRPSNFSSSRVYESDSGSASSLYAKINPKLKSKLPKLNLNDSYTLEEDVSNDTCDGSNSVISKTVPEEGIYGTIPKMTTFGQPDINVTCREPAAERESISPEEALKTIKRRNYPKVLPDIEKRRSLPVTNFYAAPKQLNSTGGLINHRKGPHPSCGAGCPPQPPPRIFGTSKSLDLPEEDENQDREPITTNLHVGPLLKRQDSCGKNRSDSSIIDSIEQIAIDAQQVLSQHNRNQTELLDSSNSIIANPKCPVHGSTYKAFNDEIYSCANSRSADGLDRNIGGINGNWYEDINNLTTIQTNKSLPNVSIKNLNWYKTMRKQAKDSDESYQQPVNDFKIVITPKVPDIPNNLNQEPKIVISPVKEGADKFTKPVDSLVNSQSTDSFKVSSNVIGERKEPKIIIAPTGTVKGPKIIIKPTTNVTRNRERIIPKVSAIPSPEIQTVVNVDKIFGVAGSSAASKGSDTERMEKPPLKEKPKVTRISSFTRRKDSDASSTIYPEKVEIVKQINAVPNNTDSKSNIPMMFKKDAGNVDSEILFNTNTIKRKPVDKK
ncbi:uncharacterized protein LOC103568161 [Microplitis demolitor]|uniref:uncharacterized protein LOC103568161 n=1 Tax=Microplitis demolitor TaxID=69319 RepID=UPI0004CD3840|nr:uncharacterized protein LOC103568161 [Microplitis demolitor]